jgi:tetratricopeptide (TPR) repeat protein
MDCRKSLVLALGLFAGVSGCQHPLMRIPLMGGTAAGKAEDEEIVHKPETYVRFGDFRLRSSLAPEMPAAARAQCREEARLSYQQALAVAPNHAPAHIALGRLYLTLEDHPRAVASFQKALEINARDGATWYELGMCHARQKEWACAVECLKRAVDIDPDNRSYMNGLGFAQVRTGQHSEALAALTRVHGEAQAHYLLARMLHHTNQDELARQHLIRSLTLDANSTQARTFLDELSGHPAPMPSSRPETNPAPGSTVPSAVQPIVFLQYPKEATSSAEAPATTATSSAEAPATTATSSAEAPATTPLPQTASEPAVSPPSTNLTTGTRAATPVRPIPIPPLPIVIRQGAHSATLGE